MTDLERSAELREGGVVFNDYDGLVAQLRLWIEGRGLSQEMLEVLAGLSKGHVGKLLGDTQIKKFSTFSMFAVTSTLGLRFRLEEDPVLVEQMRPHWEACSVKLRRIGNLARPAGKTTVNRLMPAVAKEMGRRGGKANRQQALAGKARMAKMTPDELREYQKSAAKSKAKLRKGLTEAAAKSRKPGNV